MAPFRRDSTCNPKYWVDCPELISHGAAKPVKCAVPAQILRRDQLPSREGLAVPQIQTRCILGHILYSPVEMLNAEVPAKWPERAFGTGEMSTDRPEDTA